MVWVDVTTMEDGEGVGCLVGHLVEDEVGTGVEQGISGRIASTTSQEGPLTGSSRGGREHQLVPV